MNADNIEAEIRQSEQILNYILNPSNHSITYPFLDEVDPEYLGLPDYRDVVKEPMWLRKMSSKFMENAYTSIKEFVCDFRLMLLNCYRYNGTGSRLGRLAEKLEMLFEQKLMLLPVEMRNKTTLQAVLSTGSAEEELYESGISRRRTQNKLFSPNDNRQATPMRALMEEIEQSRVGGITSSIFQLDNDSEDPLYSDLRVHLIVSRLSSWERKRHDEKLISTWAAFWQECKGSDKLNVLRKCPEFLESFQFLHLADQFLSLTDSITASLLSVDSLANPAHRRKFSIREMEYAFCVDVKESSVLSAIFTSLLASGKDRSTLTQAANTLKTYSNESQSELESGLPEFSNSKSSRCQDQLKEAIILLKPAPYDIWTKDLREKLHIWYETLHAKPNRTPLWLFRRIGVPERLFQVFGSQISPLEHTQFHELTLFKQVIILRSLVEHVQRTQDNLRVSMDRRVDWTAVRPVELGRDIISHKHKNHIITYVHFPLIFDDSCDFRVYRMIAPDFRPANTEWSPEEFVAQNFNPLIIEARNKLRIVDLNGMPVPGPVFRLPVWYPELLARFTQQRWLSLLSEQQLRLSEINNSKKRAKLLSSIKTYRLQPMASMEDLYHAEGKNSLGKYASKNGKSLHDKAIAAANEYARKLFEKDPQMTQTMYYRIQAKKGPYPNEFLSSMIALLVNNYRRLILKAKGTSRRGGHKHQAKNIVNDLNAVVANNEEDESRSSFSDDENGSESGSPSNSESEEVEDDENGLSDTMIEDEDSTMSELAPKKLAQREDGSINNEKKLLTNHNPPTEQTNPQLNGALIKSDIESHKLEESESTLKPLPEPNQSQNQLSEDVFADPMDAYSDDPYFVLVANDLSTLDGLIEQIRQLISNLTESSTISSSDCHTTPKKDKEEEEEPDEEKTPPAIYPGHSPLRLRLSLRAENPVKIEDPVVNLNDSNLEMKDEPEPKFKAGSRKRPALKSGNKGRGKNTKRAKCENVPVQDIEIDDESNESDGKAELNELLSALLALRDSVENSESSRLDAQKLTQLRYRKEYEATTNIKEKLKTNQNSNPKNALGMLQSMRSPEAMGLHPNHSDDSSSCISSEESNPMSSLGPISPLVMAKERAERVQNRERLREESSRKSRTHSAQSSPNLMRISRPQLFPTNRIVLSPRTNLLAPKVPIAPYSVSRVLSPNGSAMIAPRLVSSNTNIGQYSDISSRLTILGGARNDAVHPMLLTQLRPGGNFVRLATMPPTIVRPSPILSASSIGVSRITMLTPTTASNSIRTIIPIRGAAASNSGLSVRPRIFRVQEQLFTEDIKPVKIDSNGAVINLPDNSISPELRKIAEEMISKFKQSSNNLTTIPTS